MVWCLSLVEGVREQCGCYGSIDIFFGDFELWFCWFIVVREDCMIREVKLLYNDIFLFLDLFFYLYQNGLDKRDI